ncbi:MAG: hypothetical protein COY80_00020 [Candidatus Pacebacteria bacterium CG_4_10_14_0_8_um_filter_42_14]|nr:MAG: hypothetical protein COY80_00020 [Candidatus Pacebacteria bacterium CG_4_10_14_0_8_um_filter_42_14]
MTIRNFSNEDMPYIQTIVDGLHPKWFDDGAVKNIPFDINFQKAYVADVDSKVVGFISIRSQDGKPYIGWLGVDIRSHRSGIGKALVAHVQDLLVAAGANTLRVETVVEQDPPDGSYDLTVKFYKSCGFAIEHVEERKTADGFKFSMGTMIKELGS